MMRPGIRLMKESLPFFILFLGFLSGAGARPQEGAAGVTIRSKTVEVVVPVSVRGAGGKSVAGLGKDDFELFVNSRRITDFHLIEHARQATAGVILFDHSAKQVIQDFGSIKTLIRDLIHLFAPADLFSLATFGVRYVEIVPPGSDRGAIMDALDNIYPAQYHDRTSIGDYFKSYWKLNTKGNKGAPNRTAIGLDQATSTLEEFKNPNKFILLISDGDENLSQITLHHIQHAGIPVYAWYFPGSGWGEKSLFRRGQFLKRICAETGGQLFEGRKDLDLATVRQQIRQSVQEKYLIGFSPEAGLSPGKTHKILVKIADEAATITFRKSFRFERE